MWDASIAAWDSLTPSRFWTKQWPSCTPSPRSRPRWPTWSPAPGCPARRRTGWRSRWRATGWFGAPAPARRRRGRRCGGLAPGGPALSELARGGPDLAGLAERHLAALRDASGESAQFYVRDGAVRVCIAAAER